MIARGRLGEIYLRNSEYDNALQTADQILKTEPNSSSGLVLKGRILLAQGKAEEAISELQLAVRSEPGSVLARYYLGSAFLQANDRSKAESEWTEGAKSAGSFVPLYLSLSQLKLDAGEVDAA